VPLGYLVLSTVSRLPPSRPLFPPRESCGGRPFALPIVKSLQGPSDEYPSGGIEPGDKAGGGKSRCGEKERKKEIRRKYVEHRTSTAHGEEGIDPKCTVLYVRAHSASSARLVVSPRRVSCASASKLVAISLPPPPPLSLIRSSRCLGTWLSSIRDDTLENWIRSEPAGSR